MRISNYALIVSFFPIIIPRPAHSLISMSTKRKASTTSDDVIICAKSVKSGTIDLLDTNCKKWLMKSEAEGPQSYNINRLVAAENQTTPWEGVRNFQARNFMRSMKLGDLAFFYHSNFKKETGIVGITVITKEFYNDNSAQDPQSDYYDPKSVDNNRWSVVDVTLIQKLQTPILLTQLKEDSKLQDMDLLKKGNRLSVQKVTDEHWNHILRQYVMEEDK